MLIVPLFIMAWSTVGRSGPAAIAGSSFLFAGIILEATLFLVLYRALRGRSLASALVGTVLGIMGLVVLAILVAIMFYPALRTAILSFFMLWGGGWILVSIGMVALGVAMLGAPSFGRGPGGASAALGVVGLGGGAWTLVALISGYQLSLLYDFPLWAPLIADLVFVLLLGAVLYGLSTAPGAG